MAHRPSVPRLKTRAIRDGPSGRPRPRPGHQVPASIVRRRGRRGASVAHAARPHRCWPRPGPGLNRSLASCGRLHPSQANLTTADDGRAGSASRSGPSRVDPAGPSRFGRRPRAAGGPNGYLPPHAEPAQFDPDPGPCLRRWGLRHRPMSRVRAGVAVEAACFLVRKHESGGAGDVRLLTATPPSPPPGNEPGPGGRCLTSAAKGAGNHARADAVRRDRARDQQVVIG